MLSNKNKKRGEVILSGAFLVPVLTQSVGTQGVVNAESFFDEVKVSSSSNKILQNEIPLKSVLQVVGYVVIVVAVLVGSYYFIESVFGSQNENRTEHINENIDVNEKNTVKLPENLEKLAGDDNKNIIDFEVDNVKDSNNKSMVDGKNKEKEKQLRMPDIFVSKEESLKNEDLKALFTFLRGNGCLSRLGLINKERVTDGQAFGMSVGKLKEILRDKKDRDKINELIRDKVLKEDDELSIYIYEICGFNGNLGIKVFKEDDEGNKEEILFNNYGVEPYVYTLVATENVDDVISFFNYVFEVNGRNKDWPFRFHLEKREDGIYIGTRSRDANKPELKGEYFKIDKNGCIGEEKLADLILSSRFGDEKPDPLSALFLRRSSSEYGYIDSDLNQVLLSLFSYEKAGGKFLDGLSLSVNERQFYTILGEEGVYKKDIYGNCHFKDLDELLFWDGEKGQACNEEFTVDFAGLKDGLIRLVSEYEDNIGMNIAFFTSYAVNRTDRIVSFLNYVLRKASEQKKLDFYLELQCSGSEKDKKVEVCKMSNNGNKLDGFVLENETDSQENIKNLNKFFSENKEEKVNEIKQSDQI